MTDLLVRDCVEVQVQPEAKRLISDSELAAMRPSPRRAPADVARRASLLKLRPHQAPTGRAYRVWPFLITAGAAGSYLYVGLVLR